MPISTHHQEPSKSQTGSSEWPVQWCRRGSGNVEDFFDKTRHSLWGSQHLLLTCVQNIQWLYVSPGEKKRKIIHSKIRLKTMIWSRIWPKFAHSICYADTYAICVWTFTSMQSLFTKEKYPLSLKSLLTIILKWLILLPYFPFIQ